jgi:hypothetical protein
MARSNREAAQANVDTAASLLSIQKSDPADRVQARASAAQAAATLALAQALLDIGDILRERLPRGAA